MNRAVTGDSSSQTRIEKTRLHPALSVGIAGAIALRLAVVAGIVYLVYSFASHEYTPDAYLWPVAVATAIAALSAREVPLRVHSARAGSDETDDKRAVTLVLERALGRVDLRRSASSISLLLVAYLALISLCGFTISTPCFLFTACRGIRLRWRLFCSLVLTALLITVFTKLLYVPLPLGVGVFRYVSEFVVYRLLL